MRKPSTKQVRAHSIAVRKAAEAAKIQRLIDEAYDRGAREQTRAMLAQLQPTKLAAMKEATALVTACHKLLYSLGLIVNEHKGFGKE